MPEDLLQIPTSTTEWRKSNILIVDDEPGILRQVERDLLLEDFQLLKAASGEEGLKIIEKEPVHVIISDQKMGEGMNGTRFLAEARKRRPHLLGIILSAYSESNDVLAALVYDPLGVYLPARGMMEATDGTRRMSIPASRQFTEVFAAEFRARLEKIRERLSAIRIPILPLCTHEPVTEQVLTALGKRR